MYNLQLKSYCQLQLLDHIKIFCKINSKYNLVAKISISTYYKKEEEDNKILKLIWLNWE